MAVAQLLKESLAIRVGEEKLHPLREQLSRKQKQLEGVAKSINEIEKQIRQKWSVNINDSVS